MGGRQTALKCALAVSGGGVEYRINGKGAVISMMSGNLIDINAGALQVM